LRHRLRERVRPGARAAGRDAAHAVERAGAALIVDGERLVTELPARLAQACRPGVLQGMSDAAAALTDGTGAQKIARGMLDAGR
jgi:UDP-N-acetylglucosamine:LPS N-acetylglucosamine transferase